MAVLRAQHRCSLVPTAAILLLFALGGFMNNVNLSHWQLDPNNNVDVAIKTTNSRFILDENVLVTESSLPSSFPSTTTHTSTSLYLGQTPQPSQPPVQPKTRTATTNDQDENNDDPDDYSFYLIPKDDNLRDFDLFAATWWQHFDRFEQLNVDKIGSVEGATFLAFNARKKRDVRMTVDWMDFSVEHLSKWWKVLEYDETSYDDGPNSVTTNKVAYRRMMNNLINYVGRDESTTSVSSTASSLMRQTLALIAYMPYTSRKNPERGDRLTVASLAATMSSLIRYGCGRIVLVVDHQHYNHTQTVIWPAVLYLLNTTAGTPASWEDRLEEAMSAQHGEECCEILSTMNSTRPICMIQSTTQVNVVTVESKRNVPRAALMALQRLLLPEKYFNTTPTGMIDENLQQQIKRRADEYAWLGSTRQDRAFKYLYLTEPDTLLLTKPDALVKFQSLLDQGNILSPHRLQPIPHEYDLKNSSTETAEENTMDPHPSLYLPAIGNWTDVRTMNPATTMCCDSGINSVAHLKYDKCGPFWWTCGFGKSRKFINSNVTLRNEQLVQDHMRLLEYQLVRFQEGSRIVHLAGGEHGRQCRPQAVADGPCRRRNNTDGVVVA